MFLTSGVVQGSCLGPLLFLLFINDITKIFGQQIKSKLYADDLKFYTTIESELDEDQLQTCLDDLNKWADTWQLTISIKKCQTIKIGSRALLKDDESNKRQYHIGPDNLPSVESVVDLGVTVDRNIKFNEHIGKIVRKASTRCYLIKKVFPIKAHSDATQRFQNLCPPTVGIQLTYLVSSFAERHK